MDAEAKMFNNSIRIIILFFLQCFVLNTAHADAEVVKIQGRLVYNETGTLSKPINGEPLWNTFIGEGFGDSSSNQILIEVILKGTPNSIQREPLLFQVPYRVRKAVLSTRERNERNVSESKIEAIVDQYIEYCCHTEDEYKMMLTKLSETERVNLNKQQQIIQTIDKKDKQLLAQGFESKFHINEEISSVIIGPQGVGVLWFVVSNSECATVNTQAKFKKASAWTKKTFPFECGE